MQDWREPQPMGYGAGYLDRTISSVGRPYYPGYGPFAEDFRVEPQVLTQTVLMWRMVIHIILLKTTRSKHIAS